MRVKRIYFFRALLESHKQALLNKLEETDDPPLVLHLASLILFQNVTQNMVNASGRFVTNILGVLEKRLPAEDYQPVHQYHSNLFCFFFLVCSFTILIFPLTINLSHLYCHCSSSFEILQVERR